MTPSREQIATMLLGLLKSMTFGAPINGQTAWVTIGRRLRLWGDTPPDQQPAAFLVTHTEDDAYRNLGVVRRREDFRVWCYFRTDDPGIVGDSYINVLLEAFESTFLTPDNPSTNSNTLAGLVYWVRIEGRVFKDPGDIDKQGLLLVPLIVEMS